MKKITIMTFFGMIFISMLNINAQNFKFGVLAGFDIANSQLINKPDVEGFTRMYYPMITFNVNGYAGYRSNRYWGFSIEPGFIQKGGVLKNDKDIEDDDTRFQANYIQMPILVDFYLTDKFFLSLGPEIACMVNARANSKNLSYDISNFYDHVLELSGLFGINYSIMKNIDLGIRYNHGLTHITKVGFTNETGEPLGEMKEYNQYFQLIVRCKI